MIRFVLSRLIARFNPDHDQGAVLVDMGEYQVGASEVKYIRGPSGERVRGRSALDDMLPPVKEPRQGTGHPHKGGSQDTIKRPQSTSGSAPHGPPTMAAFGTAFASQTQQKGQGSRNKVSGRQIFRSSHGGRPLSSSGACAAIETLRLYQVNAI